MLLKVVTHKWSTASIECTPSLAKETITFEVGIRSKALRETKTYKNFKAACQKFREYESIIEKEKEE